MTTASVAPAPTATTSTTDRPLRRDAAQNRERILDAAARVFSSHGLDAGVEEIARAAGVGTGTLYRRFPTKDALIAALVHDVLGSMLRLAESAADAPEGRGLEQFLESSSAYQASHRGCLPRLWTCATEPDLLHQVRRAIAHLLSEAKKHGRVRPEVTATDLTVTMWAVRGIIETTREVAPEAWRRHLAIVVAGMRPAAGTLGASPLSRADVDRIVSHP